MSPAVAVMPPSETIFTSSRLEQMRHTQNTMPITRKGRDTVRFIGLVFYVVFKHTGEVLGLLAGSTKNFGCKGTTFLHIRKPGCRCGRRVCTGKMPRGNERGAHPGCVAAVRPSVMGLEIVGPVNLRVRALRVCLPVLCRCEPRPCRQFRTRSRATRFSRPRWGCAGAGRE